MINDITPLILTYNEAPNIGRTLEQLGWARDIVVVDSFSQDNTLGIISQFDQVRVFQRAFDNFANQCNFGLTQTGIASDWVLSLDADYVISFELIEELRKLEPAGQVDGFRASFVYCINGQPLRSGIYPPVTVLVRRAKALYQEDGHAHRVAVQGVVLDLKSSILHDDRKPLASWLQSQIRYTKMEAEKLVSTNADSLAWTDRIRRLRIVAPAAMLFYCLVIRGGVFDGWAGFYYAFQRVFAELMLSLYLIEHDLGLRHSTKDSAMKVQSELDSQMSEVGTVRPEHQP